MIAFKPGDILAEKYKVVEYLGAGGTGTAWRAKHLLTDESVICKIPLDCSELLKKAILQEYGKLRRIANPDVIKPLGLDQASFGTLPFVFLVTEDVSGIPLDEWVRGEPAESILAKLVRLANVMRDIGHEQISHGDLDIKNVIVAGDRVVLIDPAEPSRRSAPTGAYDEPSDISQFLILSSEALGASEQARALIDRLKPQSAALGFSGLAAALNALLASLPTPDMPWRSAYIDKYLTETAQRHQLYRQLRVVRQEFAQAIRDAFAVASGPFGVSTGPLESGSMRFAQEEPASDEHERGLFFNRSFDCKSRDGDHLSIVLDHSNGFRKPWPHGKEGLLAQGRLSVHIDRPLLEERLEIWFRDQQCELRVEGQPVPLGSFIDRACRVLVGETLPVLSKAERIGGTKDNSGLSNLMLGEDGDPVVFLGFSIVTGVPALLQHIMSWLALPRGSIPHDPSRGSSLHKVVSAAPTMTTPILDAIRDELIQAPFGKYLDVIRRVDICEIDRPRRRCTIELTVLPHGEAEASCRRRVDFQADK